MKLPGPMDRSLLILKTIDMAAPGGPAALPPVPSTLVLLQPAEADNDPVFHFDDPFAGMPLDAA